ncbi:MAG: Ppx/GppA phosphatase family protein, partial [Pararhodobacter sp.]
MTPERPAGAAAQPIPITSSPPKGTRIPGGPEPKRQSGTQDGGLYAALDLGTNSCRMLIARPKGPQFEVVDSFSRAVELGTGLESTGRLGHGPMARTVQALRICRRKLDDHSVQRMRLVATEACRRARNSAEFIRKIQRETGLRLEIIPAEEEARLAVISC